MIKDRIEAIQAKLRQSENVPPQTREELTLLLAELAEEISSLPSTHHAEARKIAEMADVSTDRATRERKEPAAIATGLDELRASVAEFEGSHPKMTELVGRLATTLSNMGI